MATLPRIGVGTTVLHGANDGATYPETSAGKERHFTGPYQRRVLGRGGHSIQRGRPPAGDQAAVAPMEPSPSPSTWQDKAIPPLATEESYPGAGAPRPHTPI